MTTYEEATTYAETLGKEHGKNAAGWWIQDSIGGRVTSGEKYVARKVLEGIEDGDPAIYDTFPYPDLSGQCSDSLTGPQLYSEAYGGEPPEDREKGRFTEITDTYELAFSQACEDEISQACRLVLEED